MESEKQPDIEDAETDTLYLIYQAVKEKLDLQIQLMDSLDTKAGVVIAFNAVIIAIAFSVYPKAVAFLFIGGIVLLLASIGISFWAYKTEEFRRDPEPRPLRRKYSKESPEVVLAKLIDNSIASYEANREKLKLKAYRINRSFITTFAGLIILSLSVFLRR